MKKMFLVAIFAFCILTACNKNAEPSKNVSNVSKKPGEPQSVISGDVEFEVTAEFDRYVIGDKISVTAKATNIGENIIYTVAGTSSYGANGLHMTLESSERGWFRFSDNYKNIGFTDDMYYGELKPGETITIERIFDTSDTSYGGNSSKWKIEYIEDLPEIYINVWLTYERERYVNGLAESYKCSVPIDIESKKIDSELARKLGIYKTDLVTKILLTDDTDEIDVIIWFDNRSAAKKYLERNFKDRMDKVAYEGAYTGTVHVMLPRRELIEMAENRFGTEVSLY